MLVEASITAGIRPTSMVMHTQPSGKWNKFDFLCIEAYQGVLRERCAQCGLPRWMCHSDNEDIGFKVIEDQCYAVRELEMVDEQNTRKAGYKAPKGVKARPEPFTYSGKPLDGVFRESYYAEIVKQQSGETSLEGA